MYLTGVPEERINRKEEIEIFEEIKAKYILELMKDMNRHIQ